jgi:hypothetical protein
MKLVPKVSTLLSQESCTNDGSEFVCFACTDCTKVKGQLRVFGQNFDVNAFAHPIARMSSALE